MRSKFILFLIFLGFLTFLTCPAVFAEAPSGDEADSIIETALHAVSRTERISSDFVQERQVSMLKNKTTVKGRFYYQKPDRLRWEQQEPVTGGFIVNQSSFKRWGEDGRTETSNLAREPAFGLFVNQIFAWCKGDAEWLKKRYEMKLIELAPPVIRLMPTTKAEKRYLDRLTIAFSEDGSHVRMVEIRTKDKDTITTTFINTSLNPPLPGDLFEK